jgi:hypothetical protein
MSLCKITSLGDLVFFLISINNFFYLLIHIFLNFFINLKQHLFVPQLKKIMILKNTFITLTPSSLALKNNLKS